MPELPLQIRRYPSLPCDTISGMVGAQGGEWPMPLDMTPSLRSYVSLALAFLRGGLTSTEFMVIYLDYFKREPDRFPQEQFEALEAIFTACDAFEPDPVLRQAVTHAIDEDAFRREVAEAVARLRPAI